ncbi:PREDICTED: uncharacterized protein LOC109462832 [Branchiostoma belcheri]|uniref:Uncharacterized protein LOC109462832 n=1 Tax=Branchiostoma belcheri TaxID=7741 RepID=A0A6P4Y8A5_BRABE|nr:PREDICTED: uncharacterized protein LOC109462832 [Branchiostoma belcheri]
MASSTRNGAERNWNTFISHLDGLLKDCRRRRDTTDIAEVNVFIERILVLTTNATKLERACRTLPLHDDFRVEVLQIARELRLLLKEWNDKRVSILTSNEGSQRAKVAETFTPVPSLTGDGPGRPRKDIDLDDVLHHIIHLDYTVTDLSEKYNVHRSTIYRRLKENHIDLKNERYTTGNLSQSDLQELVREAKDNLGFHQMGQKVMLGYLRSTGVRAKREEVREACRAVDPVGTALRHPLFRSKITSHAAYSTPHAQYLWHIDGVEKLSMYAIYSTSVVDGHSKKVMAVNVAGAKKPHHVFKAFYTAFTLYGIPSMVRVDHGYENKHVKDFMDAYHQREACIAGESIRNQPVERWHINEETYCLFTFRDIFESLEEEGHLDRDNRTDLMLLHYAFLPRINFIMAATIKTWNSHKNRSLKHKTLDRVWEDSVNAAGNENKTAIKNIPPPKCSQKYDVQVDMSDFESLYENVKEDDLTDPRVATMPVALKEYLDQHLHDQDNYDNDNGRSKFLSAKNLTRQWIQSL